MKDIFIVFLGGGLGSVGRFLLASNIQRMLGVAFPWGTLCVNCAGCFLIGVLWLMSSRMFLSGTASFFLFAGILGGFTTFSSYSIETFCLLQNKDWWPALGYVAATNGFGIAFTALGFLLARMFFQPL